MIAEKAAAVVEYVLGMRVEHLGERVAVDLRRQVMGQRKRGQLPSLARHCSPIPISCCYLIMQFKQGLLEGSGSTKPLPVFRRAPERPPQGFCPGQSAPVGEGVGLGLGDGGGVGDGVGVAECGGPVVGGTELGGGENAGVVADEEGRGDRVGGSVGTDDGVGAGSNGSTGCVRRAGNSEPIGSRAGTLGRTAATAGGLGAAAGVTSGRGPGPSRPRVKYRTTAMPAAAGMSTSPASRSRPRP